MPRTEVLRHEVSNDKCQMLVGYSEIKEIPSFVIGSLVIGHCRAADMGLSVNGKPPVSKTGTPRSSRGRPEFIYEG